MEQDGSCKGCTENSCLECRARTAERRAIERCIAAVQAINDRAMAAGNVYTRPGIAHETTRALLVLLDEVAE